MTEALIVAVVAAICSVESSGNHRAIHIADGSGASYGECQVKLGTARQLGYKGHVSDLWLDRETNRFYARKYFELQLARYGDLNRAIAAYNAGSLKGGKIRNTRYVHKVMHRLGAMQ